MEEASRYSGDSKTCNSFIKKDAEIETVGPEPASELEVLFENCPNLKPTNTQQTVSLYRVDIDNDGKVDLVYFESWDLERTPAQQIYKIEKCSQESVFNSYRENRIIRLSGKTYIENDVQRCRGFPGRYFPCKEIYEAPWSTPVCGYVDKAWNVYKRERK